MTAAASVAACLAAIMAPTAHAGAIWVTDGNMNAGQTGGCNAFGVYGNLSVFSVPSRCPMSLEGAGVVPQGQNGFWMTTAPPGVIINSAWTADGDVSETPLIATTGFVVGDFWRDVNTGAYGGSTLASNQRWFNTSLEGSSNINSQIYGIQLLCTQNVYHGGCPGAAAFTVGGIELKGTENSAPYVTGQGALWGSGSYVWNPPGDPWPVILYASDVSGICSSAAIAGSAQLNGPSEPRDNTVWQQCPNPVSWRFNVDTRSQVPSDGTFQINLSATNAAGMSAYAPAKTVLVDNDPVGVSFSTPNDANPSVWVNHAVTVDATATAGPSHVGGMNCSIDRGSAKSYPAGGLTVNGDGVHTVSCTAWNKAVGPQGQPDTGSSSLSVHIDEAPPSLAFAPQNPRDPTKLVVNTSDAESGVAAGSIQMAPAGTTDWTSLPTNFDGTHLTSRFDDSSLRGAYAFKVTSCDALGNCGSTTERLTLPQRLASDEQVSLTKIIEQCTTKRVRNGRHGWRLEKTCKAPHARVTTRLWVPYGHSVTIHGLYTTAQGAPLANQAVHILAAPDNQSNAFADLATATTASDGSWSATLPPGPSRVIRAVTYGTATILPSRGQVTTVVPARIRLLQVWPRHVAWGGTVHLVGQLFGGYLPPGGALVRLRIGYGSTFNTYGIKEHVTGNGRFSTVATFGPGDPSVFRTYWFQIASLPMGNYPYAPAASQHVPVIVGGHPRHAADYVR